MMKQTIYIVVVLLTLNFSCKGKEEGKVGADLETTPNDTDALEDEDGTTKLNELFGVDVDELSKRAPAGSTKDPATIFSLMMGREVSVDKSSLSKTDMDALKAMLEQYPEMGEAIVISDTKITTDVSKFTIILSQTEGADLKAINDVIQKIVSPPNSKKGKPNNPYTDSFFEEELKGHPSGNILNSVAGKGLYQELKRMEPEEARQKLADHYGIDPKEVDLLQGIGKQPPILNEKQAMSLADPVYGKEVEAALLDANASPNFKALVQKSKEKQQKNVEKFMKGSTSARAAFFKLNPSWYSEKSDEMGNTYRDTRNQLIYLPLGERSFADEVVEFVAGTGGMYPEGALHEPDLPEDKGQVNPLMCNIGLRGVLTLQFTDNAITDVNGPDLYVFESGAIEPTILELSKDGSNWLEVGKIKGGTAMVDIHDYVKPGETFTYVRLTDLATPSGVPGADVDAVAAIGGALRLNLDSSVLFEFGKYELRPEAEALLKELIPQIAEIGKGTIIVEGHTDNVGSVQANNKLSEQRANSVGVLLKTLMKATATQFKWEIKGHGDGQPIAPNDSDENRQKNRRVELLILPN
ncbi:OmpA family protein [Flagellimonas amoyensis]|uniref:OmpA family protein n=1 Tax=Flagellimonas amoyensis TaxID=2169401 RepID=UPI000D3C9E41|nr:OmpA family protein [Allomuricauda amoyensis]